LVKVVAILGHTRALRFYYPAVAPMLTRWIWHSDLNRASNVNVEFGVVISGRVRASKWDPFTTRT